MHSISQNNIERLNHNKAKSAVLPHTADMINTDFYESTQQYPVIPQVENIGFTTL